MSAQFDHERLKVYQEALRPGAAGMRREEAAAHEGGAGFENEQG
jgi:hypothetical protein